MTGRRDNGLRGHDGALRCQEGLRCVDSFLCQGAPPHKAPPHKAPPHKAPPGHKSPGHRDAPADRDAAPGPGGRVLRIQVENDADGPAALVVSAQELALRLVGVADVLVTEHSAPASAPASASNADIVLACRKFSLAAARRANPSLRWVQVTSAGVETWLPELPPDMLLTNASGVHGPKGGEFILAACLMLNFAIPGFVDDRRARAWRPSYGSPIRGRTVTLLGVGGIGRDAVTALAPLGVRVVGVTRSGRCDAAVQSCIGLDRLDAALAETDILVSTLPLTADTRGLIDRRRLGLLPRGAGVVVVGRAGVFDYDAMRAMLTDGRLGGAVLDVFPTEPLPPDDPLWDCPRIVMTPHCSLDDHAAYREACLEIFCDNVARFAAGAPLRNRVDPARGY